MANHGFGHIKQKLTVEQVNNDLHEINQNRFNGWFNITHENHEVEIWLLTLGDESADCGFQIWFDIKRNKLEWPHAHGGDANWWFQETFTSMFVSKYKGKISDEGCDGKWNPEFHIKYPHMIDWFIRDSNWIKGRIKRAFYEKFNKALYKETLKRLPDNIKDLL